VQFREWKLVFFVKQSTIRKARLGCFERCTEELSKISCNEQYLPPSLPNASPENRLNTTDVIAIIVIACKLCHGWEFWSYKNVYCTGNISDYRSTKTKNQTNYATDRHKSNEAVAQGSRLIPWNDCQLRLLTNFAMMFYLDFFMTLDNDHHQSVKE
jgi:hypothetical protein